jgi:D-glycero-alpha-D-manno-heptose 1-phosphate guanylyltransferase
MKAIILCGGLGTRLGAFTRNTPKPLIEVAGRPFLAHVLDKLCIPEIDGFILATGFHADHVANVIKTTWQGRNVDYSVEDKPLGTGGALRLAMQNFDLDIALVVNGDTLFDCDLCSIIESFESSPWATRMALRSVDDCSRYGRVALAGDTRVINFGEKGHSGAGLINAGVYVLSAEALSVLHQNTACDMPVLFERLQAQAKRTVAFPMHEPWLDVGRPEDLRHATE